MSLHTKLIETRGNSQCCMYRYRQKLNQDRLHFPVDSKDHSLIFCLLTGRSRSFRGKQIIRKESLPGVRGSEGC